MNEEKMNLIFVYIREKDGESGKKLGANPSTVLIRKNEEIVFYNDTECMVDLKLGKPFKPRKKVFLKPRRALKPKIKKRGKTLHPIVVLYKCNHAGSNIAEDDPCVIIE